MTQPNPEHQRWSPDEVARLLTSSTALMDLDHASARIVVKLMKAERFAKGAVILQEGVARNGFMMLVLRGEVVVEQQGMRRADSVMLGVVGVGGLLGEMSLLDGEPRSATCTAHSDVEAAVLDRETLAKMMESHPLETAKLFAVLLKRMSSRLRVANRKIKALTTQNQSLAADMQAHLSTATAPPPTYRTPDFDANDSGMIIL